MSNVNRPRKGMKACPHCASTDRDSNGQCHCRNVAYRALRGSAKTTAEKARKVYDATLKSAKGDTDKALAAMREEFPSLAAKARKAPADNKPKAEKKTAAQKKAAKAKADKQIADAKDLAREKAATKKAHEDNEAALEADADPLKGKYVLHIEDDFTDPYPYSRKDLAVKNGVKSGEAWRVVLNGKVVAVSDDVL
jgi:flagellar biosynthesis GTPase FlhF